ncbi:ABC transporter-like protein 15 [Sarcoptes scabiei]|uniref:ABC transporter-like protein 15 n=1 Tax=Sarcoptes scabiei TaxID=52283 RepID=A0A132AH07_SARSC|nr:ABC transporter-like protein 15 [Sarcoptes scabiei]
MQIFDRPFCFHNVRFDQTSQYGSIWPSILDFFDLININFDQSFSSSSSSTLWIDRTCSEQTLFAWIPLLLFGISLLIESFFNHRQRDTDPNRQLRLQCSSFVSKKSLISVYFLMKLLCCVSLFSICMMRIIFWFLWANRNDPLAPLIDDSLKTISWIIVTIILFRNHHQNRPSSASVFVFLVTESAIHLFFITLFWLNIFDVIYPQSLYDLESTPSMVMLKTFYTLIVMNFLLFECQTDTDSTQIDSRSSNKSLREKLISPETISSFFSKITFSWFTEFVMKVWHNKTAFQEDLWLLNSDQTSQQVLQPFKRFYQKLRNQKRSISIMRILFRIYWLDLLWIAFLRLCSSLFIFVNPIVLDSIISFLNPTNTEPKWKGFLYSILMFVSPMLESMFNSQHEYRINLVTMRMKTSITAIVYHKSLRLSNIARQRFSTGEIVNLISVDAFRIVDLVNNLNTIWSAPLQILVGVYLLWLQLRYASFAGFSFMLLVVPINIILTQTIRTLQLRLMSKKDSRSKLINEILNGIKVIKLNSWENHFERKINEFRSIEMKQLRFIAYCQAFMNSFFSSASIFVALFSFLAFTLISPDNVLDANRAFVSLALFNVIRIPLVFLPLFFNFVGIALVSIDRLNQFLQCSEVENLLENPGRFPSKIEREQSNTFDKTHLKISNGNFAWNKDDPIPTLSDINIVIESRRLVGIVGGVGSGKSSLMSAILGEMEKLSGKVDIRGRIAYVPQEAWILNDTIRENILLNKKYDAKKYKKVLEACSLEVDLTMFAAGDMTEVGEKGINLSGGQKQRISLARAIYSNSDIYLLDNPLSALDAHVSKHIFDNVIGPKGCLRNKTRVLVTSKLSLLPMMDHIIYMSRGEIKDNGKFDDLLESRGEFSEYVSEYYIDHEKEDLDDEEWADEIKPKIQPVIEKVIRSQSLQMNRDHSIQESRLFASNFISQTFHRSKELSFIESEEILLENIDFNKGRLIGDENIAEGEISSVNQKIYLKTIGFYFCMLILDSLLVSNVFQILNSLWLSEWSNDSLRPLEEQTVIFSFFGTLGICLGCVKASKILHDRMLKRVLRAPMSFFDTTPIGRILNRFTRDIDTVDSRISTNLRIFIMQVLRTFVAFGFIGFQTPLIVLFFVPLIFGYYWLQGIYRYTLRQLKRIESVTRSPMNNLLSETVNGITSIRAYGLSRKFTRDMWRKIDDNNQSYWLGFVAARWLAVRLEFISYSVVFLAAFFAVYSKGSISPGLAGLAISYSLNITSILNLLIRTYSEVETNFVSVERIVEYIEIPKEKQLISPDLAMLPYDWPSSGEILFENYSTQYRPGLKLCLKRINLKIPSGSKVAIVGRTGSGKSSLSLALFRILNPIDGTIYIDDVNIRNITLERLRQSLTIVPQDPLIFTATLRDNIDVLEQHSDSEIIEAISLANLNNFFETINNNLYYYLASSDDLSVGQRQLICLARALLKKNLIVVFDEATACKFFCRLFSNVTVLFSLI